MKLSAISILANEAMKQAKGYKLTKGESTEVNKGAVIYAYGEALTSWQDIEGVNLKRRPRPVIVTREDKPQVKQMFVVTDLINEECHTFTNLVILN